jgi:hypothetical protein
VLCTQVDFVLAIASALNREGARGPVLDHPPSAYVNTLIVPEGSAVAVDKAALAAAGVAEVEYVRSHKDERGRSFFDAERLVAALQSRFADIEVLPGGLV